MSKDLIQSIPLKTLLTCAAVCLVAAVAGAVLIAPHNKLEGRKGAKLPMRALGDAPVLQLELARNEGDIRAVLMQGDIARNQASSDVASKVRNRMQ